MPLTHQQSLFCAEYPKDLNATRAAIRAGYSQRTANESSCRLMKYPVIRERIEAHMTAAAERAHLSTDWVLEQLKQEALNAKNDAARVRALELIGKHLAMFVDRHRINDAAALSDTQLAQSIARGDPKVEATVLSWLGRSANENAA